MKKEKKKERKKEKHQGLGLSHLLPAQGLQICGVSSINYEWSLLFLTRRASRGTLTSALFHFLSFFFVSLHLRRTSPKGKGLLVVYQCQKCFLKHENHALSRARVWRHEKGSNNTIPSPPRTLLSIACSDPFHHAGGSQRGFTVNGFWPIYR